MPPKKKEDKKDPTPPKEGGAKKEDKKAPPPDAVTFLATIGTQSIKYEDDKDGSGNFKGRVATATVTLRATRSQPAHLLQEAVAKLVQHRVTVTLEPEQKRLL